MRAKPTVIACALMMGFGAFGASTALAGENAGAGSGTATEADTKVAKKKDISRRLCRTLVASGTRLPSRACRTQEQWDSAQDRAQDGHLQHQMTKQTLYERQANPN